MAVIVRIVSADGSKVITQTLSAVPSMLKVPEGAVVEVIDPASGRKIPVAANRDDDAPRRDDADEVRKEDAEDEIEVEAASDWTQAEIALADMAGDELAREFILADLATGSEAGAGEPTFALAGDGGLFDGSNALLLGIIGVAVVVGGVLLLTDDDDKDTTAPDAPTGLDLAAVDDTGASDSDNVTSLTTGLTISGSAEADSTVELFDGSTSLGTATAGSDGAFSLDVDLAEGTHTITATATDAAGNVSTASSGLAITVDATAPSAPQGLLLDPADDDGVPRDGVTDQTSGLTISGTALADSTVELFNGQTSLGTTTAAADGSFSIDVALPAGAASLTAIATDAAGNASASSAALPLTVSQGPQLINSSIDGAGDVVTLYFSEPLDSAAIPAASSFTVSQGGAQTISDVDVTGNRVMLKLTAPLAEDGAVSVSFTGAGLTDVAGNAAASFSAVEITNRLELDTSGALRFSQSSGIALDGAEISAFDAGSDRIFVTGSDGLQVVSIDADLNMSLLGSITVGDGITSVAAKNGIVAVAVAGADKTMPGKVYFIDADGAVDSSAILGSVEVGANPDMVVFTPDGSRVLVANEAELSEDGTDPEGSVSIIDLSGGVASATVTTAGFDAFNGQLDALKAEGVRLFAGETGFENTTVAQDLEPEYIAISADGSTALVTLQENNAVAVLDIASGTITDVRALGLKNFEFLLADFSDRDDGINLTTGNPVFGQFMPDAIASFTGADGDAYFVIANEGDDRDDFLPGFLNGFEESERIKDLDLDASAFPDAADLQEDDAIGRLGVSQAPGNDGDLDGDGDIDQLLAYGARSFSILDANGNIVFDSGSHIEQFIAGGGLYDEDTNTGLFDDGRSDNKGPEPEGITVGQYGDSMLAFVTIERGGGGVMIYDVTNPADVTFVQYVRDLADISPEGVLYISAADSPSGEPLLIVSNEESATVTAYEVTGPAQNSATAMLDAENGYFAQEIFTVGETIGGYTPPGVMDGIGAMELDANTVRVFVNHELGQQDGYIYELANGTELTGSRISYFDISKDTLQITGSGLAYDTIYDAAGNIVTDTSFLSLPDFTGLSRFCSAVLYEGDTFGAGMGIVDTIYFTGEEDGGSFNAVSGAEWALDVATGELWALPAFGRGAWENIAQIDTGTSTHVAFILSDDTSPFDVDGDSVREAAPLYLYVGEKDDSANANFIERNGLADGELYVWVPGNPANIDPEAFTGEGNSQAGSWVLIDNSPNLAMASDDGSSGFDEFGYPTQRTLWAQAEDAGAFQFSRPEDVATNPFDGSEVVLASTGRQSDFNGADLVGEIYTMDVEFDFTGGTFNGATGDLVILYDGDSDAAQTLRSPDNLDWASDGLIYVQEDRAVSGIFGDGAVNPNEAGIVRLDPDVPGADPVRIANIDRLSVLPDGAVDEAPDDVGNWESSGILDVSALFGQSPGSLFLADVQAHGIDDQGRFDTAGTLAERIVDTDLKEGGQLLFLYTDAAVVTFG